MSPVTRILSAIEQGDPHAAEQLLPLVRGGRLDLRQGLAEAGDGKNLNNPSGVLPPDGAL
jgi:hypothetical protein